MTTYTAFTPSPTAPFQFQPTLDGQTCTVIVTWGLFGQGTNNVFSYTLQRWYVSIFDTNGNLVVYLPLIASPLDYDISLTAGYFTSTLIYRADTGNFEVSP